MHRWSPPADDRPRRVIVDRVRPQVDGGRFAIKRTVGERVTVSADVFADGHDLISAVVRYRLADAPLASAEVPADYSWREVPMRPTSNDRWEASFDVDTLGRWEYTVSAWIDRFGSWREELAKKVAAAQDVTSELLEGAAMIRQAAIEHPEHRRAWLVGRAFLLEGPDEQELKVAVALADALAAAMAERPDRSAATTYQPMLPVTVERPRARFSAWYELFPRSAGPSADRSGTFDDVARRLPDIAAMGFDVLYLPPIHPIGRSYRKGPNNTLGAGPNDPGSPWAIGGPEGGHTDVEPGLGTLNDFDRLVGAARRFGIEIALDIAFQASPDHPWVMEHPEWFRHRPDGSIKYAENPPKKYQDIFPLDFESRDWRALWNALAEVIFFWIGHGVRIFRVDNPHTKPFPFWEWLIGEVRRHHPDTVFLAEAFTRPKPMCHLAKAGFSQSYTYFTWRNTKSELIEYLTELSTTAPVEFFRPHFFVNTPDINPYFLQASGRAGFLIRAVLATTTSGLWGMYSGFELCEGAPLPGREEYLDSEKYEIRVRDWNAPGNIVQEITALNRIRRASPALHSHRGIRFYNAGNDQMMVYGRIQPGQDDMILVAVSLDPHHPQETDFELPLWEWKLPDSGSLAAEDLMTGHRFTWTGKNQRLRLDPAVLPFAIWRLAPEQGDRG